MARRKKLIFETPARKFKIINNYVAFDIKGKLTLLHKGILLRPVICERKYKLWLKYIFVYFS